MIDPYITIFFFFNEVLILKVNLFDLWRWKAFTFFILIIFGNLQSNGCTVDCGSEIVFSYLLIKFSFHWKSLYLHIHRRYYSTRTASNQMEHLVSIDINCAVFSFADFSARRKLHVNSLSNTIWVCHCSRGLRESEKEKERDISWI